VSVRPLGRWRRRAGLRALDIAAMLSVTPETVSRWERGTVETPRAAAYVLGDLLEHPKLARERFDAFARQVNGG
jgi:transcriptional regulator with XRE-family HTH domain